MSVWALGETINSHNCFLEKDLQKFLPNAKIAYCFFLTDYQKYYSIGLNRPIYEQDYELSRNVIIVTLILFKGTNKRERARKFFLERWLSCKESSRSRCGRPKGEQTTGVRGATEKE